MMCKKQLKHEAFKVYMHNKFFIHNLVHAHNSQNLKPTLDNITTIMNIKAHLRFFTKPTKLCLSLQTHLRDEKTPKLERGSLEESEHS